MRRLPILCLLLFVSACSGHNSPAAPAPIPALPNYTDIWSGTYTVTSCSNIGTAAQANFCATFAVGSSLPFQLNIDQSGTTAGSTIQGNFTLGSIPFNLAPTTITASSLSLSGTTVTNGITALTTWSLTSPIVGTLTIVFTQGQTGQANVGAQIGSVAKTGSVRVRVAAPTSLPDLLRQLQEVSNIPLE
jgi:hypothetical protein